MIIALGIKYGYVLVIIVMVLHLAVAFVQNEYFKIQNFNSNKKVMHNNMYNYCTGCFVQMVNI